MNCTNNFILLFICIGFILFLTCYFNFENYKKIHGGSISDNPKLNAMINNGILTDEQKMKELEENIKKSQLKVKKHNNIYNNLLTNLTSTEDEIENAEANLEDAKNNLSLAEINLYLKNSLILLKKNKNPKKKSLLEFNVALNRSKQYNIQTIISLHKTKQLRKNTLKSPSDTFFKTELLNSIEESVQYAQQSHIKAKEVYTLCISTDNPEIIKYKADLNNSKNLAKNLEDNIINIKNRIAEKYKLQDSIKNKLLIQKKTTDNKVLYESQIPSKKLQESEQPITKTIIESEEKVIPKPVEKKKENNTVLDTITNLFNF
ncbi:MAG: hypothetical protein CL847_04425 [Crocinitomicaceae bacterium]|nr:hypothetical protein [Crocinitomicaceae bacterium]|tara:strand:- start:5137 stop:6090 length:954 start_codon:yes stop_codon:yes gene_type:complete